MRNKNKLLIALMLLSIAACTDRQETEQPGNPAEINLRATLNNTGATTRADDNTLTTGDYLLYLPLGSYNLAEQQTHPYTCTDGALATGAPVYWDDMQPADPKAETTFYLTSKETTQGDILWGEAKGWNEELTFEMQHCMSRLTIELLDETLEDLDFKNAKVVFSSGLITTVEAFDFATGDITPGEREEETTITHNYTPEQIEEANGDYKLILEAGEFPPQAFAPGTQMHITAGSYVFTIDLPAKMTVDDAEQDIALVRGQHLTMTITLSEEIIKFDATLKPWEVKNADPIDVTRVFNISNWNELYDLMQAIASGYTFKGMVVRLTKDIEMGGQVYLGTKENPFEGIFDGNGKKITNMVGDIIGETKVGNGTALFAYTRGATIQNLTISNPEIESTRKTPTGSIVDTAEDTTLFNNLVEGGSVKGDVSYIGGMVGKAIGKTSLTNCYADIDVKAPHGVEYVGGLVGYTEGTITHCSAKGEVVAAGSDYVGGLVGYSIGDILHCFAWGGVTGDVKVGGLIGFVNGSVANSYAAGFVDGSTDRGGLFGNIGFDGTANYCYWYDRHEIYGGTGSAALTNCESYTNAAGLVTDERLNKGYPGVWKVDNNYAVFSN